MNDTTSPATSSATEVKKLGWLAALHVYLEPASWRMLCLGFSAGLPLLLVLGTLSFRLREAGIDRSTIGFLSWVGLAYGFKWVWSPLVDRMPLPLLTRWLGRRRSWLLLAQATVVAGLVGMALLDPQVALEPVVWCALVVAFGSATQDIALDAFRIESADAQHQAALAATYQTGYRLAMIWAGAGVLWIAAWAQGEQATGYAQSAWQAAYLVMALSMLPGMLTVIFSREPAPRPMAPARNAAETRLKTSAEVQLLRESKQYQAAYDLLTEALVATPTDLDFLYDQAMMAEKTGRSGHVEPSEIAEAALTAGLSQTSNATVSEGWAGSRLVAPKAGKSRR